MAAPMKRITAQLANVSASWQGCPSSPLPILSVPQDTGHRSLLTFLYKCAHEFIASPSPRGRLSIESKADDRPATFGSLQAGYAADSRRFRVRHTLIRHVESRHEISHRTSCRAPRGFPGSALGPSRETCGTAARRTATADRSACPRARSKHAAPSRDRCGARDRRRYGDGQTLVRKRIFYSQPPHWRKYPCASHSFAGRLPFPGKRLLGLRTKIPLWKLQARIPHRSGQAEK